MFIYFAASEENKMECAKSYQNSDAFMWNSRRAAKFCARLKKFEKPKFFLRPRCRFVVSSFLSWNLELPVFTINDYGLPYSLHLRRSRR